MKAVICDDDRENASEINKIIKQFFSEKNIAVEVSYYSKGYVLLERIKGGEQFDVIFMDINLITEDGINIISDVRFLGCEVPVIFVTSYENRAIDGYDVDAFAFVTKKSMNEKLPKVLQKLYSHLYEKRTIAIADKENMQLVNVDKVLFVESDKRSTLVHLYDQEITDSRSITHFAEILSEDDFVEVHKSVYVNISKIKRINTDTVELEEGIILPLSRRSRKQVMLAVMKKVSGR